MRDGNSVIRLNSIDTYHKLYGLPTYHPLVSVVDLKQSTKIVNHLTIEYGLYALFLKNGTQCTIKYGRRSYDYQEGTVTSFSPGQIITVDNAEDILAPDVIGLLFHPDLIYGTPLGQKITQYGFFDYSQREALHLSQAEREMFLTSLDNIRQEVEHPVDHHSASLIAANVLVLLEYIDRFYDRQFITRHKVNSDLVANFERQLRDYFLSGKCSEGVPTVAYFAEKANLSAGYFGDLVRKETGVTAQDTISNRLISYAKHRLASTADDVSVIAYDLGFQYPQHFTRLFKRVTGQSPTEYRKVTSN